MYNGTTLHHDPGQDFVASRLMERAGKGVSLGQKEGDQSFQTSFGRASVFSSAELIQDDFWKKTFSHVCRDGRYYHLTEKTLPSDFAYRYLVLFDQEDRPRSVQPMFFVDQDLTAGLPRPISTMIGFIRKGFPRFLITRMLMVGSTAGEGHLGYQNHQERDWVSNALHEVLGVYANRNKVPIIVLKDFPAEYRETLAPFSNNGYTRIPSLPAAALDLNFSSFDHYLQKTLSKVTRKSLRRKFKKVDQLETPIQMEMVSDITPYIEELYPLYLQVYNKARFKFEKITREYLCQVGRLMPDRSRFFIWRHQDRAVAFSSCMVHDGVLHDCYIGLDYSVALDLHLYFVTFRDVVQWSIQNNLKCYYSGPLSYDPKLHLRFELRPLDLYVCHTSKWINPFFRSILRFLQPARHDPVLRRFRNASEL